MKKQVYEVTVHSDGRQEWRQNRKLHRLDGPAYIYGDYQAWWVDGLRHRIDGPAIIDGNFQAWWIEGKQYTKKKFDRKIKEMKQEENYLIFEGKKYQLVKE